MVESIQTRNLPVPMSHYRQQVIKPPFVFNPREGLLEDILEREAGTSNKFPGINAEESIAYCYENMSPEQQAAVKQKVGEENIPKPTKPTKPKAPVEAPKPSPKPTEKAAEEAAKSSGKWGWIIGGAALAAAAIYGYNQYSHKQAQEKQLNVSA